MRAGGEASGWGRCDVYVRCRDVRHNGLERECSRLRQRAYGSWARAQRRLSAGVTDQPGREGGWLRLGPGAELESHELTTWRIHMQVEVPVGGERRAQRRGGTARAAWPASRHPRPAHRRWRAAARARARCFLGPGHGASGRATVWGSGLGFKGVGTTLGPRRASDTRGQMRTGSCDPHVALIACSDRARAV